jgi:P-type Cu2+ transporter
VTAIATSQRPDAVQETVTLCAHCSLVVHKELIDDSQSQQFCCAGCRTVYKLIHSSGLDRYYNLRKQLAAQSQASLSTGERYEELDDPTYQGIYTRAAGTGGMETELLLEGVHCGACVWLVERLGRVVPGVLECRLNLRQGTARVVWDPQTVSLSTVARGLDGLGYPPHPPRAAARQEIRRAEDRTALIDLAVAGFLAGNIMLIAFALYGGMVQGMASEHEHLFRWVSALLGVVSLAWPGRAFFRGAWSAIRTRSSHLDIPIALALAVGGVWGLSNTIRGTGEIYFDSLSVLVFLLLVGRNILRHQQRRSASAVELLYTMTPSRARRVVGDKQGGETLVSTPLGSVQPEELLEVRPGEIFPVDGVIEDGESTVDASMLTGEPDPINITSGDLVAAGTVNGHGVVRVRVSEVGERSRVGRLMQSVADAATQRSAWVRRADRIAGWFVATVVVAACATLWAWWPAGAGIAIEHTTALLIVSCPCALGLATPLVMTVACGRLARQGVLVKGGEVLERLAKPGIIMFDKTGTLTEGSLRVRELHGEPWVWPMVTAVEQHSQHPVARTLVAHLTDLHNATNQPHATQHTPVVDDVKEVFGSGLSACVDGYKVLVGSLNWMAHNAVYINASMESAATQHAQQGWSTVWISVNAVAVGLVVLGDTPRRETSSVLSTLRGKGWETRLLTGDRADVSATIGRVVGFTPDQIEAELSPEDKLNRVRLAASTENAEVDGHRGSVVMIGDGVNDAAAMAAADVGIAVRGGAEVSLEAADVYLQSPGLNPLLALLAQVSIVRTRLTICMVASISYNITAATLAITGVITPIHAAIIMPVSSLTVLAVASIGARPGRAHS